MSIKFRLVIRTNALHYELEEILSFNEKLQGLELFRVGEFQVINAFEQLMK